MEKNVKSIDISTMKTTSPDDIVTVRFFASNGLHHLQTLDKGRIVLLQPEVESELTRLKAEDLKLHYPQNIKIGR